MQKSGEQLSDTLILPFLTRIKEELDFYFGDDFLLTCSNIQTDVREIIHEGSRTGNHYYERYKAWTSADQLSY